MSADPFPSTAATFLARARQEAGRYGNDPWIFVRELIQNARDAGASRVAFTTSLTDDGGMAVQCTDDGEGMERAHAERYLFSLYTSSKDGDSTTVGKFGVGFWSILRFEPDEIDIHSRTRTGVGFGLRLSGQLDDAHILPAPPRPGTTITLRRTPADPELRRRLRDAAWQNARYVTQRDDQRAPLLVTVDGESINAPFALPAPATAFRRGPIQGVVALGSSPRVELFSRGLRVRSAATLDDLLSAGAHTARSRVSFPELPGQLAPQVLLDHPGLELMLSRGDARDDKQLVGIVNLAREELERLVEETLLAARSAGVVARVASAVAFRFKRSLLLRTSLAAAAGVPLAFLLASALTDGKATQPDDRSAMRSGEIASANPLPAAASPLAYSDLSNRYHGPQVDTLDAAPLPFDLRYTPPDHPLYFAALRFADFDAGGQPTLLPVAAAGKPYPSIECDRRCVVVELSIDAGPGPVRIPVAAGMDLVSNSARVDDARFPITSAPDGLPQLVLPERVAGTLRYRLGPTRAPAASPRPAPDLPDDLRQEIRQIRRLGRTQRVAAIAEFVSDAIAYDRSASVAAAHEARRGQGEPLLRRALEIGAGDCDIQNSVLVAMLNAAGVPARLAVGIPGRDGRSGPWLHAWAEVQDERGAWFVLDVSEGTGARPLPTIARVAGPPSASAPVVSPPPVLEPAVASPSPPPAILDAPPTTASENPSPTAMRPPDPRVVAGVLVVLALAGFTHWRRRTARTTRLDSQLDVAALLDSALSHPGSFRSLPAVYDRPLVPVLGGGAVSLARCRALAQQGRLYGARGDISLTTGRLHRNAALLDLRSPEARVVARALSTTDLDHWERLLAQSRRSPLLDRASQVLREHGEAWDVRLAPPGVAGIRSIDLTALRRPPDLRTTARVVVVDELDEAIADARRIAPQRPARALFVALDRLTHLLRLPARRRAELLADAARDALLEGHGGPS